MGVLLNAVLAVHSLQIQVLMIYFAVNVKSLIHIILEDIF